MSALWESPFAILPGQYFDAETGLYQNWHRDYDPGIGRYLQSDPIGLEAGLNSYAYALSNPARYADSDGLCPSVLDPGPYISKVRKDKRFVQGRRCDVLYQDRGEFVGTLIRSEGSCVCEVGKPVSTEKTCIYSLVFKGAVREQPCGGGPWSPWVAYPDRDVGELRAPFDCVTGALVPSGFSLKRNVH